MTHIEYYAYRLHPTLDEATTILTAGKLFQQYIVDGWAAEEQRRLAYLKTHQGTIRSELYNQVIDAFTREDAVTDVEHVGNRVILPASFTGSSRDMMQNLQNSFCYCMQI
jgi:hypothetical protein